MKINNASSPAFSATVMAGYLKSNERSFEYRIFSLILVGRVCA
jgi:hypothetical protein